MEENNLGFVKVILGISFVVLIIALIRSGSKPDNANTLSTYTLPKTYSRPTASSSSSSQKKYYPYEGMPESKISSTDCGPYSKKESVKNVNGYTWAYYHWYNQDKECVMSVMCMDGEVKTVSRYQLEKSWNSDGSPRFDTYFFEESNTSVTLMEPDEYRKRAAKENKGSSGDRYNVQDFDDPDEFAEYWIEEFLYDEDADDDEEALDEAYNDAWDYWWDHHK